MSNEIDFEEFVHNENAEIIPDSKNKSGQNDVDDIELNTVSS